MQTAVPSIHGGDERILWVSECEPALNATGVTKITMLTLANLASSFGRFMDTSTSSIWETINAVRAVALHIGDKA